MTGTDELAKRPTTAKAYNIYNNFACELATFSSVLHFNALFDLPKLANFEYHLVFIAAPFLSCFAAAERAGAMLMRREKQSYQI